MSIQSHFAPTHLPLSVFSSVFSVVDILSSPYNVIHLSSRYLITSFQLGAAEKRSLGPTMAGAAGEEAPLHHNTLQLQTLPHHGDQPQGVCVCVCVYVCPCVCVTLAAVMILNRPAI